MPGNFRSARPQVGSRDEALELASAYRQALLAAGVPLERLLLFGSFAHGKFHSGSDVDLAVVSPKFGKDNFEERLELMRLRRSISSAIEPHPLHPDDLNDRWSTLAAEIRQHGIPID